MTPERYQQVKTAFRLALDLPPEERVPMLTRTCGDDAALFTQVLALLETDIDTCTAIDSPAVGQQFRLRTRSLSYTAAAK